MGAGLHCRMVMTTWHRCAVLPSAQALALAAVWQVQVQVHGECAAGV